MFYIYDSYNKEYTRVSKKCFQVFVVPRFEFVRTFDDNVIIFYDIYDREIGFIDADKGVYCEY